MYRLFRHFAIGALAAFLLAGVVLTWLNHAMETKDHIELGERRHITVARLIENTLSELYLPLLYPVAPQNAETTAGHRARLRQAVENALAGTDVLRLKLYDLAGNVVFFHPAGVEHIEIGASRRVRAAIDNQVFSRVLADNREHEFELAGAEILETYITTTATLRSRQREPVGVIELYTDIAGDIARGHRDTVAQSASLITVLAALYGVLLLIVRRADGIIKKRDRQSGKYLQAIERGKRKAEEGSRAKSEFLTHVTHEIRTPMNTVVGTADLLLKTDLDAKQRDYVNAVAASGETLLHVIDKILDVSSVKAGTTVLDERRFYTHDVVHDVQSELQGAADAKGLTLGCRIDPKIDTIYGDAGRLRKILVNLLDNSIKFTSRGRIVIEASLLKETADESWLRFLVQDPGVGISPEHQKRMFEPFTQVDRSTTRRHGGIGLGLTLCRHLVEDMGGEIGVESEPGEGTKIWCDLPFTKVPAAAPAN